MIETVRLFVEICAEFIKTKGPVYEFGSFRVPGQEELADLRPFWNGGEYVGCDMREGIGVDRVEDLEKGLSIRNGVASVVLSMETLEHVFDVPKAMAEMKRVLKDDDGVLIISSPFMCPIHAYPSDYWRFTPVCFERLLSDFDISLVVSQGDSIQPSSIFGIGIKTKNKEVWKETLSNISKKFNQELNNRYRYNNSFRRNMKLAFYRAFLRKIYRKKYLDKINRTNTAWNIQEKIDLH